MLRQRIITALVLLAILLPALFSSAPLPFALVTLAFAEVFRIGAVTVDFTGGGVGMMLPLNENPAQMQFDSRRGYLALIGVMVVVALLLTAWLRHSRFGARLQAVRDNEDAASAIGVDPYRTKLAAITLSGPLATMSCSTSVTNPYL